MLLSDSPSHIVHIHGTFFKAYPSGIWENPPFKVQSWELASGNAAILEAKWPWPGKFTFHYHSIPEERGAMGYFNVTNAPPKAIDGKDVAITCTDNNLHAVTSGVPNTAKAGQTYDSGLTALIMSTKIYSHKFTNTGEFSYFCRVHPTMVGKILVVL